MGKRGPAKMPTALRIATGMRGHVPLNKNEPKASPRRPDKPPHLDEAASEEWDRIVPIIEEMGTLSKDSGATLAVYCEAHSTWLKSKAQYHKEGVVVDTPQGTKKNPAFDVAMKCTDIILKCLREFGLTPASRAGIVLDNPPGDKEENLDDFVSKKNKAIGG